MDLWHGPLPRFVELARSGRIATDMVAAFYARHGAPPSVPEIRSWEQSLTALADIVRDSRLTQSALAIRSTANEPDASAGQHAAAESSAGVSLSAEYHMPLDGRRIDVLLFGTDNARHNRAVALELKQWSACEREDEHSLNVLVERREHVHPSQQASDYAAWLADYHSAFVDGDVHADSAAWCHNMTGVAAATLRAPVFGTLLARSPLFIKSEEEQLVDYLAQKVGAGGGMEVLDRVTGGHFRPSVQVIECLEAVIRAKQEWHLLDEQRLAYNAIIAGIRRAQASRARSVVLVRGGPGTGKTVIAVQLLADALRLGLTAAHTTGGKAFTTVLRSKFRGADDLFRWNMNFAGAPTGGLDLLLVDEAHRVRTTSNMRYTPKARRSTRTQFEELIDAAKVAVFFLDENQFVRPDEIGTTREIEATTRKLGVPLKSFDLALQFRCSGCKPYVDFVDWLLGFSDLPPRSFERDYAFNLAHSPQGLDELLETARERGERARLVAGFCWKWSDPAEGGALVQDVQVGSWTRPWNEKALDRKTYRPGNHPYTLWAETDAGVGQVGCIYSAQGFEFDQVGVVWGRDLVWRSGRWAANKAESHDKAVRGSENMERLVRNAYRVLLTRGTKGTRLLCLDDETREHVKGLLEQVRRGRLQAPLSS